MATIVISELTHLVFRRRGWAGGKIQTDSDKETERDHCAGQTSRRDLFRGNAVSGVWDSG